jgi:hypothetical protein
MKADEEREWGLQHNVVMPRERASSHGGAAMTSALWFFQGHWRLPEFSPPMRCSADGSSAAAPGLHWHPTQTETHQTRRKPQKESRQPDRLQ